MCRIPIVSTVETPTISIRRTVRLSAKCQSLEIMIALTGSNILFHSVMMKLSVSPDKVTRGYSVKMSKQTGEVFVVYVIEIYKMYKGFTKLDIGELFVNDLDVRGTRGVGGTSPKAREIGMCERYDSTSHGVVGC